ncbi:MAG: hypothetical protein EKK55_03580 [Rhodocyclaceae bacterium]|nr:MAG: hypothetical protein EKK55_03580 [Rhodocyclaceae bacterium]
MAAGKFDGDIAVTATGIAAAFNKDAKYRNPFDRRKEREKTPEELEHEAKVLAAQREIEARVAAKRFARMQAEGG